MKIREKVSLGEYSTMRLGGEARYLCETTSLAEIKEATSFAHTHNLKILVIGGGSNTIFSDEGFDGLVIINKIKGVEVTERVDSLELTIGAGEEWDEVVTKSVSLGFGDIAALSLIPGSTGGAPVQNIGAYGQQISDSIVSVDAYDLEEKKQISILQQNCNFSYRTSRFNQKDKGKFIITAVKLQLRRKTLSEPFYKDVARYFELHNIPQNEVSPGRLREAVIAVRSAKLPDPKKVSNTGSFFKNPIVAKAQYHKLLKHYPQLKSHETDDGKLKLYAGQLIELAGLKNYHDRETGMATWKNQALVLVNESAKSTADLLSFKKKVIASVHAAFGITLVQEPELIG